MNEKLNHWKNGVDDGYFNNTINVGSEADDNSYNYFYVTDEL